MKFLYQEPLLDAAPSLSQLVTAFRDAVAGGAATDTTRFAGLVRPGPDGEPVASELVRRYRRIEHPACRFDTELAWLLHWNLCQENWLWAEALNAKLSAPDDRAVSDRLARAITALGLPVHADLDRYVAFVLECYRPGGCFGELRFERLVEIEEPGEIEFGLPSEKALPVRLVLFALLFQCATLREQGIVGREDSVPIPWLLGGAGSIEDSLGIGARYLTELLPHLQGATSIHDATHQGLMQGYDWPRAGASTGRLIMVIGIAVLAVAALAALIMLPELVPLEWEAVAYTVSRVPMPRRVFQFLQALRRLRFPVPRAPWPFRPYGRSGVWMSRFSTVQQMRMGQVPTVPNLANPGGPPIPVIDPYAVIPGWLLRSVRAIRSLPNAYFQWWLSRWRQGRVPWTTLVFPFVEYEINEIRRYRILHGPASPPPLPREGEPQLLRAVRGADDKIAGVGFCPRFDETESPWDFISLLDLEKAANMYPTHTYAGVRTRWTPLAA